MSGFNKIDFPKTIEFTSASIDMPNLSESRSGISESGDVFHRRDDVEALITSTTTYNGIAEITPRCRLTDSW